jgi:hypothetical protein
VSEEVKEELEDFEHRSHPQDGAQGENRAQAPMSAVSVTGTSGAVK